MLNSEHQKVLAALSDHQQEALAALADEIRIDFVAQSHASMTHGEMGARIGALEVLKIFVGKINAYRADE